MFSKKSSRKSGKVPLLICLVLLFMGISVPPPYRMYQKFCIRIGPKGYGSIPIDTFLVG